MFTSSLARFLIMDRHPIAQAGINMFIEHDERLRKTLTVFANTVASLEDGIAISHRFQPQLIALDVNLPVAYNNPQPVNLFTAVKALTAAVQPKPAIILLYEQPAALTAAVLLLKAQQAVGLIAKADLNSTRLRSAIDAALCGEPYVYCGAARKLDDVLSDVEFFTLEKYEQRLIEWLERTDSVCTIAKALGKSEKTVYRYLRRLARKFGTSQWRDIPALAAHLGILHNGVVQCECGMRKIEKYKQVGIAPAMTQISEPPPST